MTPQETEALLMRLRSFFRAIEEGAPLVAVGPTWDEVFAGDVSFQAEVAGEIYTFTVFNDCDDVDYLDSIEFPGGADYDFDVLVEPYEGGPDLACEIRWFDRIEECFKAAPSATYVAGSGTSR